MTRSNYNVKKPRPFQPIRTMRDVLLAFHDCESVVNYGGRWRRRSRRARTTRPVPRRTTENYAWQCA